MTLPRPRRKRPRFNGSPSDHAPTEQWLSQLRTSPADGTTYQPPRTAGRFGGASDIGLPGGAFGGGIGTGNYRAVIVALATGEDEDAGPAPLASYRPAPASFPALPAAPGPEPEPLPQWERDLLDEQARQMALPVLRDVPVTERAVIGDYLRLPVIWCEMPRCISWHHDPASAGFGDSRHRAIADGWRYDALGRLACLGCQQSDPAFRTLRPVAWYHPAVRRRWRWDDPEVPAWWESGAGVPADDSREEDVFRLGVEAELGRRINRESPALALAIAGATARTAGAS